MESDWSFSWLRVGNTCEQFPSRSLIKLENIFLIKLAYDVYQHIVFDAARGAYLSSQEQRDFAIDGKEVN